MNIRLYEVGGFVRDGLLGIKSKDRDITVVLEDAENLTVDEGLDILRKWMVDNGYVIFVETPEHACIRAHSPVRGDLPADFVLARREGPYSDGRRPDYVEIGTLEDDLDRRDFSVNAMARSVDDPSVIIDRHNGLADLQTKTLRFVGDPLDRIREDGLRIMRAIRFKLTKGFEYAPETWSALYHPDVPEILARVSEERRDEELRKMFDHAPTTVCIEAIGSLPRDLQEAMFSGRVRLTGTLKK